MSTVIIAEAGVNHNGDIEIAKKLVDAAVDAGADYVKFQTFKADKLATLDAKKAPYQLAKTSSNESQHSMLKSLELTPDMHQTLKQYCDQSNIKFLSSAFDIESLKFLMKFEIPIIKVPSGEITNLPYLRYIGSLFKPVILSSGMATLGEVEGALDVLLKQGLNRKYITVLHCNTEYPTPMSDVNLKAMCMIGRAFNVDIGYSDHTLGIEVAIAAVAMGAKIIEKHLTLDRAMPGPDHAASLEPNEFSLMVQGIKNIEMALGSGIKKPSPSEYKNINIARKSIVACDHIKKGELLTEFNLAVKRPGSGISPMQWDNILGKFAEKDYGPDDFI